MKIFVTVDGFTYEGKWLSADPSRGLHVRGPLEYKRPTRGYYRDGWTDDSGPTGRATDRHRRWWRAAHLLADKYREASS